MAKTKPTLEDYIFDMETRPPDHDTSTDQNLWSQLQKKETDLLLAAELGKALLEKNEEQEKIIEEYSRKLETLIRPGMNTKVTPDFLRENYHQLWKMLHKKPELRIYLPEEKLYDSVDLREIEREIVIHIGRTYMRVYKQNYEIEKEEFKTIMKICIDMLEVVHEEKFDVEVTAEDTDKHNDKSTDKDTEKETKKKIEKVCKNSLVITEISLTKNEKRPTPPIFFLSRIVLHTENGRGDPHHDFDIFFTNIANILGVSTQQDRLWVEKARENLVSARTHCDRNIKTTINYEYLRKLFNEL